MWGAALPSDAAVADIGEEAEELTRALRRATHGTIDAVSEDYETLHFNTAISKLMELTNAIVRGREAGLEEGRAMPCKRGLPAEVPDALSGRTQRPGRVAAASWQASDRRLTRN